jgi:DNA-binding transcriptional LysR family regulator
MAKSGTALPSAIKTGHCWRISRILGGMINMAAPVLKKTITKLDLLSLRLFLTICEERSIGRAAERESITASAVTKRVQELEYLFDVKLLYRNAKGTVPTPVGEALAEHARGIFKLVESIRIDLSEFAEGVKGHVRVAAIPSALIGFAAADLRSFIDLHPQVDIDVREHLSTDVVHAVATGTADIGIYASPPAISGDVETVFYRHDELRLLVPGSHPLAFRKSVAFVELLDCDFIGVQENSSVMNQLRRSAVAIGRQFNPRYSVHSNEVARSMVAAGFGITILPLSLAAECHADQISTIPLTDEWARRELRICVRRGMALPAQARLLLDFLRMQGERKEARKLKLATDRGVKLSAVLP